MQVLYNARTDVLYLRLDPQQQPVMNKRLSEYIVLDVGEDDRIVGIEIIDASKHLNLAMLLPIEYIASPETGIDEQEWLRAAARNSAFDFVNDSDEDIYTLNDGKPFKASLA
jgi:uncharacterized protein YuzE